MRYKHTATRAEVPGPLNLIGSGRRRGTDPRYARRKELENRIMYRAELGFRVALGGAIRLARELGGGMVSGSTHGRATVGSWRLFREQPRRFRPARLSGRSHRRR